MQAVLNVLVLILIAAGTLLAAFWNSVWVLIFGAVAIVLLALAHAFSVSKDEETK